MPAVQAVFEGGVFRPLEEVQLPENQRVVLDIHPAPPEDPAAWLAEVQATQEQFIATRGYLPDSALDIAADRARDE